MAVLPLELIATICDHLQDFCDLKNFRLACRPCSELATPKLFGTFDAGYEEATVQRVDQQLQHPHLFKYATSLAFDACTPSRLRAWTQDDPSSEVRFGIWYNQRIMWSVNYNLHTKIGHKPGLQLSEAQQLFGEQEKIDLLNRFPKDGASTRQAHQAYERMWTAESSDQHLRAIIERLDVVFKTARIETLVLSYRGYTHDSPEETREPDRMFDPHYPEILRDIDSSRIAWTLPLLLDLSMRHEAPLRHLTVFDLPAASFQDKALQKATRDVFPDLVSLRLHINDSLPSALQTLLSLLGSNLRSLKLAFNDQELTGVTYPFAIFEDLHWENLRTLHLNSCYATSAGVISLLQRHRAILKDVCFSDMDRLLGEGSWKDFVKWLRGATIPLDAFRMIGYFGESFSHFLAIHGTFTRLPDETIATLFEPDKKSTSYVLVEDDGTKVTWGPKFDLQVRPMDPRTVPPEPWAFGDDLFDWKFYEAAWD